MRSHKRIASLILILLAVLVVTAAATLHRQNQSSQLQNQQPARPQQPKPKYEDERWPLVDYDSPNPNSPKEQSKRQAENSRYDKQHMVSNPALDEFPGNGEMNRINHWAVGFPGLPVERSNVIVLGDVTSAKAYLSNDKTGIYSEFTMHVSKVLKDDSATPVAVDNDIKAERIGGRIRTLAGHIQQYGIHDQGMPKLNGRYVLFLKRNAQGQDYSILTGYELSNGHIMPLDGVDYLNQRSKLPQFAAYEGMKETVFLTTIQNELSKLAQPTP